MNQELISALDLLEEEKGVPKEELIDAIESSIASAFKRNYKDVEDIEGVEVKINKFTGEITVYEMKKVVDEVSDEKVEITLEDAQKIDPDSKLDDIVRIATDPKDIGRIAAQNAKQIIMQKLTEVERNKNYDEYIKRVDENLNGTVVRVNNGSIVVNLGAVDAVLQPNDQIPNEVFKQGDRIKVYLNSVRNTPKGLHIKISRSTPNFIKRLFEEEVPEINEGKIEIVNIARDPGYRTKIALTSSDKNLDVIGTSIGRRGSRINNILSQIGDERIDIVEYSKNTINYIKSAFDPADIYRVLFNRDNKTAIVVVEDDQLPLIIGRDGKNVKLASRLTGYKIDIKSINQYKTLMKENPNFENEYKFSKKLTQTEKRIKEILENEIISDDDIDIEGVTELNITNESLKELFED